MTDRNFTKHTATQAALSLSEIFRALPSPKQLQVLGAYHTVARFIDAASLAAPAAKPVKPDRPASP
jgi:hypothetical protein